MCSVLVETRNKAEKSWTATFSRGLVAVLGEAIFSKLDLLGEKARDRLLNAQLSLYLTKLFPRVTPPRATQFDLFGSLVRLIQLSQEHKSIRIYCDITIVNFHGNDKPIRSPRNPGDNNEHVRAELPFGSIHLASDRVCTSASGSSVEEMDLAIRLLDTRFQHINSTGNNNNSIEIICRRRWRKSRRTRG